MFDHFCRNFDGIFVFVDVFLQAVAEERNQRMRMESVINGRFSSSFIQTLLWSSSSSSSFCLGLSYIAIDYHSMLSINWKRFIIKFIIIIKIIINTTIITKCMITRSCEQVERGWGTTTKSRGLWQREQKCSQVIPACIRETITIFSPPLAPWSIDQIEFSHHSKYKYQIPYSYAGWQ